MNKGVWLLHGISLVAILETILLMPSIERAWLALAGVMVLIVCLQMRYWKLFKGSRHPIFLLVDCLALVSLPTFLEPLLVTPLLLVLFSLYLVKSEEKGKRVLGGLIIGAWLMGSAFQATLSLGQIILAIHIGLGAWLLTYYRNQGLESNQRLETLGQEVEQLKQELAAGEEEKAQLRDLFVLKERNRISRELHDSVGHTLSTLIIQLGALTKVNEKTNPEMAEMTSTLRDFASQGLQEVRQVIHDMKPIQLSENHIFQALEELFSKAQLNSQLDIQFRHNELTWHLDEEEELLLYRVVQESLANTQKYAQASKLMVTLMFNPDQYILTIHDNGKGTELISPRMGLNSIKKRVTLQGGTVDFSSSPGQGFKTQLVIPKKDGGEGK